MQDGGRELSGDNVGRRDRPTAPARLAVDTDAQLHFALAELKGRLDVEHVCNQRTAEGILEAIRLFKESAADDPSCALALAGLADAYALAGEYRVLPAATSLPLAKDAAMRALDLNPGYASAHQWLSELLTLQGKPDQAIAEAQRALDLDPASPIANAILGITFYIRGPQPRDERAAPRYPGGRRPEYLAALGRSLVLGGTRRRGARSSELQAMATAGS